MTILQYCSQVYLCLAVLGPLDQLVLLAPGRTPERLAPVLPPVVALQRR